MKRPINTNELRAWAERYLSLNSDRQMILQVADELDAARTDRNIARAEVRKLKAAARPGVQP